MPLDQFPAVRAALVPDELPSAQHVFVACVLCVVLTLAMPTAALQLGLLICGGVLGLVAACIGGLRLLDRQTARRQRQWANHFMANEFGAGFVTDAHGTVHYANAQGMTQFRDIT